MTLQAILDNRYLVSVTVVTLSLLGCAIIVTQDALAWLAVLGLALVSLVLRFPAAATYYLMAVCMLQPLALRIVPAGSEVWTLTRRIDEFSLVVLLPLVLLRLAFTGRSPLPRATLLGLAGLVALGGVAAALQGTSAYLALLDAFLLLKGFLFFAVVRTCPTDERTLRALLWTGLALALAAAAVGLVDRAVPELVRAWIPLEGETIRLGESSIVSIFEHEGQAGWFFAFCAAVCYGSYWTWRRYGLLGLFALFSVCALLTLRRKPIGGLLVVLALSLLLSRRTSARLRAAAVGIAAVLGCYFLFGDLIGALFSQGYEMYVATRDPSTVARNAMYIAAFRIAVDHFPFGVGFALFGGFASQLTYSPIYHEYGLSHIWGLSPTHGSFLMDAFWPHVLGQFGFLGLGLFLVGLWGIWRPLLRGYLSGRLSPLGAGLALAACFAFGEAFVESSASPVFESTLSTFFLFGLAGLASARLAAEEAGPAKGSAP